MIISGLCLVIGLLIGYVYGKHTGLLIGRTEGNAEMSLLLRQQSLEHGYCVLCATSACINKEISSHNRLEGE
ncbi:hypothetical protein SPFL3102_01387 [Sporomusaceae bacterium FL31]|nr:hypothetical protein SPFL3101_00004 [Sporomusaceae bacterium FL31]GCE33579.1 hypothetical protein SPFL3102_01387 [Sporomusaceae bacterium]